MTVKELKKILQALPDETVIFVEQDDHGSNVFEEANTVEVTQMYKLWRGSIVKLEGQPYWNDFPTKDHEILNRVDALLIQHRQ